MEQFEFWPELARSASDRPAMARWKKRRRRPDPAQTILQFTPPQQLPRTRSRIRAGRTRDRRWFLLMHAAVEAAPDREPFFDYLA